tara:strand:+ start:396 stop:785 length:390 start_codon:yes stop_codon:yes gene_type:complete
MEKYLYFSEGGGADATTEAAMYPVSSFLGVEPETATTTRIYFKSPMNNDTAAGAVKGDFIEVTHADTHAAAAGHRVRVIAQAMAEACNAGPHADGSSIAVIDVDNSVYFGGIADIIGDASFGITVNLDS